MAPPNSSLPPGSFLTCGSDDTIRIWTLDKMNENNCKGIFQPNIYSNVSKILYSSLFSTHVDNFKFVTIYLFFIIINY